MPQEPRGAGGCIVSSPRGASGVVGALWCIVGGLNAVGAPEELHTFQRIAAGISKSCTTFRSPAGYTAENKKPPEALRPRGRCQVIYDFFAHSRIAPSIASGESRIKIIIIPLSPPASFQALVLSFHTSQIEYLRLHN